MNLSATSEGELADVTDSDVLGIRHDPTFETRIIAASCKSGEKKSLSIAKEIFYLKGILTYLGADEGVVIFSKKPVPPHVRDLGRQLDVLALSGNEADHWLKALTNGIPDPGYFRLDSYNEYLAALASPPAAGIVEWLAVDYWFYNDFRNLHRILVKLGGAMNGSAPWHSIVFLHAAAHFSLTILDLCRQVQMLGVSRIAETTPAYLFGGATSYRARRELYTRVQQVLKSTSGKAELPTLEPPYTQALTELVLRFIARPHAAIRVPQTLQDRLWRMLGATGHAVSDEKNVLAAEKLSEDLLDFMKTAANSPWAPTMYGGQSGATGPKPAASSPAASSAATSSPSPTEPKTLLDDLATAVGAVSSPSKPTVVE